jgi:hypothetical protein
VTSDVDEETDNDRHDGYLRVLTRGWSVDCLGLARCGPDTPCTEKRKSKASAPLRRSGFTNFGRFDGFLTGFDGYWRVLAGSDGF